MSTSKATLSITIEDDPTAATRTLTIRCPHAITTLPLPRVSDAVAERTATTLAVLQHYSTTTCVCRRVNGEYPNAVSPALPD